MTKVTLALLVVFAFVAASLVATPAKATAIASTDVYVHAVDENAANLSGESIKVCYYGVSTQLCTDPVSTDAQGNAMLSVAFPASTTYASVWAGTQNGTNWISEGYINLTSGALVANYPGGPVVGTSSNRVQFVQKPKYSLSGTVRLGSSSGALQTNFPLSYEYQFAGQWYCENIPTNGSGAYSITSVKTSSVSFRTHACNTSSAATLFDTNDLSYSMSGTYSGTATKNIVLTQTGIKVHVTEGVSAVVGVEIRLVPQNCTQACYPRIGITDANGDAIFAGLEAGSQWKAAYPSSDPSQFMSTQVNKYVSKVNTASTTVSTGLTSDALDLVRTSGYPDTPVTVSGKVVSGPLGNQTIMAGAQVSMNWNARISAGNISGYASTTTNSNGEYSFSNIPYGNVFINVQSTTVSGITYKSASLNQFTSLSLGTTYTGVDFNLRPEPAGNLTYSGTLKQTDGTPIVGRTMYLYKMGGSSLPAIQTGAGGAFSFTNLTAGNYYISVDTYSDGLYQNLPWSSSSVLLTANSTSNNLTLALKSLVSGNASANGFIGSYVDTAGEGSATGFANKDVYLYPQGGGQGFNTKTGADGTWTITGLSDGEKYWVSIQGIDHQNYEYPRNTNSVTARTAGSEQHRMLFKSVSAGTGSLTGRVKNSSNYSNLAGIQVNLYRDAGGVSVPASTTNAKGEFSFAQLPAGEYYMQLNDPNNRFKPAYMSAEIGAGSNRINALLTPVSTFPGVLSGVIKDERGVLLSQARVQIWDPNNSDNGGYDTTDSKGQYEITGLPVDTLMNFKVAPPWDIEFDVTTDMSVVTLSEAAPVDTKDVQLQQAGLIAGHVDGIPSTGNVPGVFVQLIDASSGATAATEWVNSSTGAFSIKSVRQGSYYLLFTQLAKQEGYTGGGGFGASGGAEGELVSLQPVYWKNGVETGTTNKSSATTISVSQGQKIVDKTIKMTRGSTITGALTVETPSGISKLTGTRWVQVYIYQKQPNGDYFPIGYPQSVSGYTNSQLEIAGLGAGTYKLKFEDFRKGANSLATVFNGGVKGIVNAPEIVVGSQQNVVVDVTMKMAPPEKTADAFDLDDLSAAQLADLENQITTSGSLVPGGSTQIFVGTEFAGEYVSAVANSTPVALGGWQQVDKNGYISVSLPLSLSGSHRIAVQDANAQVIGWTPVEIADTSATNSARKRISAVTDETPTALVAAPVASLPKANSANQNASDNSGWQWLWLGGLLLLLAIIAAVWAVIARRK